MSAIRRWLAGRSRGTRRLVLAGALGGVAFGGHQGYRVWATESARRAAVAAAGGDDLAAARRLLADFLADRPDDAEANLLMARTARRDGDFAAARRFLKRAEATGWEADAVAMERTLLDAQAGDFRRYEGRILEWARLGTGDLPLFLEVLIPVYLARHDLGLALELLEGWADREPANAQAQAWLSETCERLGQTDRAIAAAAVGAAAAPDRPDLAVRCGRLLLEFNRAPEALPHLERAVALAPADRVARLGLAKCRHVLGDTARAVALLDALLAEQPADPPALIQRGQVAVQSGDPAAGERFLARALAAAPSDLDALSNMAAALSQQGRVDAAKTYLDRFAAAKADLDELSATTKAVALDPRNADLRCKAGVLLLRNGHHDGGVQWLRSALAENPRHRPTLTALAEAQRKK